MRAPWYVPLACKLFPFGLHCTITSRMWQENGGPGERDNPRSVGHRRERTRRERGALVRITAGKVCAWVSCVGAWVGCGPGLGGVSIAPSPPGEVRRWWWRRQVGFRGPGVVARSCAGKRLSSQGPGCGGRRWLGGGCCWPGCWVDDGNNTCWCPKMARRVAGR